MHEKPLVIREHTYLLHKEYNGYVHHELQCYSQHARIIRCESVRQEKSWFLLVHVLDRGHVADVPEVSLWVTVYQRLGEVTPLGPNPGELVGVVPVEGDPHVYYVFLSQTPRARRDESPASPAAPEPRESQRQPAPPKAVQLGLVESPQSSAPPAEPASQDEEELWI